jgi:hypothetical protein
MYCQVGEDSDVTAYFHMMGHLVCETCDIRIQSKGGLRAHLQEHVDKGDRIPASAFSTLHSELDAVCTQASLEGRNSIRRPKPFGIIARALMVIINP